MRLVLSSPLLESFLVLARELNFSRAADLLHITQPALTKRIQNLESALGQALFIRQHGALEMTESGRIVGSSRVDLQACKLEYSIVSPK